MSFYTYMSKNLKNPNPKDSEWYLKATYNALNDYLLELDDIFLKEKVFINGNITNIETGITMPITHLNIGHIIPNKTITIDYSTLKKTMWCGVPELTFINLFDLIGKTITDRYNNIQINSFITLPPITTINIITPIPMICGIGGLIPIKLDTSLFETIRKKFYYTNKA